MGFKGEREPVAKKDSFMRRSKQATILSMSVAAGSIALGATGTDRIAESSTSIPTNSPTGIHENISQRPSAKVFDELFTIPSATEKEQERIERVISGHSRRWDQTLTSELRERGLYVVRTAEAWQYMAKKLGMENAPAWKQGVTLIVVADGENNVGSVIQTSKFEKVRDKDIVIVRGLSVTSRTDLTISNKPTQFAATYVLSDEGDGITDNTQFILELTEGTVNLKTRPIITSSISNRPGQTILDTDRGRSVYIEAFAPYKIGPDEGVNLQETAKHLVIIHSVPATREGHRPPPLLIGVPVADPAIDVFEPTLVNGVFNSMDDITPNTPAGQYFVRNVGIVVLLPPKE